MSYPWRNIERIRTTTERLVLVSALNSSGAASHGSTDRHCSVKRTRKPMKRLTGSHFGLLAAFVCCGMINHKDLAIVRFHGQTLVVDTGGDTLLTRSTVLKLGLRTHLAHKNKATFAERTLKLLGRRDGFIVAPQAYFSHWYLAMPADLWVQSGSQDIRSKLISTKEPSATL